MHDKTYQYMISNRATAVLKSELQDILKRDKENRAQIIPTDQLQVASAELALRALNGDYGINNVDPLLDSVGALYARNKSLTKGHATLTRRVQELEAELKQAQQPAFSNSSDVLAVVGGETHIKEVVIKGSVIQKAQHDLQQFVNEEVKRQIVAAIKTGGTLNGR